MQKVLITGATGQVGKEVITYLDRSGLEVIPAVRNVENAKELFDLNCRHFDFDDEETFDTAFPEIDILFLLRPPHISEVDKYFYPLLKKAEHYGIGKVVFLSVQGADKSKVIPHNRIERLIRELGFEYIFVRPGYFMQNLTTSLLPEIKSDKSITLPAGDAVFNWIDVSNIGEVTAKFIENFDAEKGNAYDITGEENLNFEDVSLILSNELGERVNYKSVNPLRFFLKKKKEGIPNGFAVVMTILHFLPRFQAPPEISDHYERMTGKKPTRLVEFIRREKEVFRKQSVE